MKRCLLPLFLALLLLSVGIPAVIGQTNSVHAGRKQP